MLQLPRILGDFDPAYLESFPSLVPDPRALNEYMSNLEVVLSRNGSPVLIDKDARIGVCSALAVWAANYLRAMEGPLPTGLTPLTKADRGVPAHEEIIDKLVSRLYSGSVVNNGGERVELFECSPEYQLRFASFLTGASVAWDSEYAANVVPFGGQDGSVAVPIIGDIWWHGFKLTSDLETFPLKKVLGDDGAPIRQPVYYKSSRSLVVTVDTQIYLRKLSTGGFELPSEVVTEPDAQYVQVPVIAFQYVGVGLASYSHHFGRSSEKLERGERFLVSPYISSGRTYPPFWGQDGIFTNLQHQDIDGAPTGGAVGCDETMAMERSLLANGAQIGALTVGYCKLLSKEQLDAAVNTDSGVSFSGLHVQVKAITDSELRLSHIVGFDASNPESDSHSCVSNTQSPACKAFSAVVCAYYGECTEETAKRYLTRVATTMGTNLRAMILSGLTLPVVENSALNLSLTGMLCDVENCVPCKAPYEFYRAAWTWLRDLQALNEANPFFKERDLIDILLPSFHSACTGERFSDELRHLAEQSGPVEAFLAIGIMFTTGRAVAEGYKKLGPATIPAVAIVTDLIRQHPFYSSVIPDHVHSIIQRSTALFSESDWEIVAPSYYSFLIGVALGKDAQGDRSSQIRWI